MIYWDNNGTTPLDEQVLEAMLPYLREQYFNPSAGYRAARLVKAKIEQSREQLAALIGAEPDEIIFCSCGSEASNTALHQMQRVLISATEHPATRNCAVGCGSLAPVQSNGLIDAAAWAELCAGHDGASFAWANHETGVIQDVARLCNIASDAGLLIHVDAVQAAGKLPINLHDYPISYASLSAHKIHGPKGVGALYRRRGAALSPYLRGGSQESSLRAGTENVAGIIGFAKAAQLALAAAERYKEIERMRNRLEQALLDGLDGIIIHGAAAPRLPHVSHFRASGVTSEQLSFVLEPAGIIASAGAACMTSNPEPSYVLKAMGLSDQEALEGLRISMSRMTTQLELDQGIAILLKSIKHIRSVQSMLTGPVTVYRP